MANPPSRKRTWKDAAGASKSRPFEEPWHKDQGPARQERPWWQSRRAKLGFVFSALLLVISIIIVVVFKWDPGKPIHLVLIAPGYETNLFVPHNVPGRNGVKELKRIYEDASDCDFRESDFGAIEAALKDSQSHITSWFRKSRKTVVVFVSAHGVARFENVELVPYLAPEDYGLNPKAKLYPFDEILKLLDELPKDTPKLLLLDVTQVNAHWPLGELHNDFARALDSPAQRKLINEIPNLVVISSSGEDQRSWVAPEWGQTYFAHFILEGLKGAADGIVDGKKNGRVNALELFKYVNSKVNRRVRDNRARPQLPVLFGEERADKMELVTCEDYQEDNRIPEEERDYKDLQREWEVCRELRKASPHPAVYAPHLWRRYLDELVRAEQLWRCGDADTAKKMLNDLKELQSLIIRFCTVDSPEMKSAQLTLTMPRALGLEGKQDEVNESAKLSDWVKKNSAKNDDPNQAIDVFEKNADKDPKRRQIYRAALADGVLRNVIEDPEGRLKRARRLLGRVDPVAPDCRAAETHYLMMLADNLALLPPEVEAGKPSPRWPLLKTSLQLRRRAEQAALGLDEEKANSHLPAYSEQVLPWIQKLIDDADGPRRRGQDLLFSSSMTDWDEAKKLSEEANHRYEEAQKLAGKIRHALDLRDRLYAELPYYTHWVAEVDSEHEADVVKLWGLLHELRSLLEKPATGAEVSAQVAKVDALRQRIDEEFKKMQGWVEESAKKENPDNQDRWHEIEAALTVPFLEPGVRLPLLEASRDISQKLSLNPPKESAKDNAGSDLKKEEKTRGLRQGRLALAVLGEDWSKDWSQPATIKRELDNAVDENWPNALARAGAAVGELLNHLPEAADKKYEEAARKDNLDEAAALLQSAARDARTIEGAAATRMTQNPIDEQRRLKLHDLLCWQAHRTYLDWWAELPEEKPAPQMRPYYQRAGQLFLEDAEPLGRGKTATPNPAVRSPRLKRVDEESANLQPNPMVVERSEHTKREDFRAGPAKFYWTDKDNVEWLYRLRGPKSEKFPGHPVRWVKGDSGLRIAAEEKRRRPIEFGEKIHEKVSEPNSTERPPTGLATHSVEAFFRGHRSQVETTVILPERPDRVVSLPPLRGRGHVAVQTKKSLYDLYGAKNTAIALVLDLSGSMNSVREGDSTPRYRKAIKALERVLEELPDDVTVSLLAFGMEDPKEYRDKGGIDVIWEPHLWRKDELDNRMRAVKKLRPAYVTPLIRSIWMASKEKLLPRKLNRSIVVITDGGDSNFYLLRDEDLRGGKDISIKDFMQRNFEESDIQISVIGFEVNKKTLSAEESRGYKEFKPALEAVKGTYYDAENNEQLTEYLTRSLLHMYFQIDPDRGRDVADRQEKGQNISQSDKEKNRRWVHLDPDFYRIRIPSIRSSEQRVDIRPGDALLLDLVRGPSGRPAFCRGDYAESVISSERPRIWTDKSQNDWLLAVLQNHQLSESTELQLMATLEKTEKKDSFLSPRLLQQIHPGWVWFDVSAPAGTKAAPPLRITSLPDYPADAWGIDVLGWPVNRPAATLKTWWIERSPHPRALLAKEVDFQTPNDPRLGDVVVEPIELKRLDIQVEGRSYQKDVNCLMVRLSYPADKEPYFVRLSNNPDRKIGEEHRFYTNAGKYTGIFWPVTEKDLNGIEKLELFSVTELKKLAHCVEKLELDHPTDRFKRPDSARPGSEEP